jgi:uncharacterized membrane protein YgdD (TMEM256/DUF423 family)
MRFLTDVHTVTAESAIAILLVGFVLFSSALYMHRWLSKLAGHPVHPTPTIKHIP